MSVCCPEQLHCPPWTWSTQHRAQGITTSPHTGLAQLRVLLGRESENMKHFLCKCIFPALCISHFCNFVLFLFKWFFPSLLHKIPELPVVFRRRTSCPWHSPACPGWECKHTGSLEEVHTWGSEHHSEVGAGGLWSSLGSQILGCNPNLLKKKKKVGEGEWG